MKELTKAEEEIMQILWHLKKGFVKDILEMIPEPKPAYNTVSTIVRILERKGFVGYRAFGKTHEYYPLISKETYTHLFMKTIIKNYFSNSYRQLVSFFAGTKNLSLHEMEEIKRLMDDEINKIKADQTN